MYSTVFRLLNISVTNGATAELQSTRNFVEYRCLVCGEILRSNRPDALIQHLRRKHPFINVDQTRAPSPFPLKRPCPPPCPTPLIPQKCPCPPLVPSPPVPPPCPPCTRPCCPPKPICPPPPCAPCPPQPCPPPPPNPPPPCPTPCAVNCQAPTQGDYCKAMERKKRMEYRPKYKCTVESWKPGCTKVVCPCCGCEAQPVIRRQRNQLASSSLGACLMLGCWPLSFLPFMLCESNVVNLYCAQCNNFLGAYNQKEGCIIDVEAQLCNPGIVPSFPHIPH